MILPDASDIARWLESHLAGRKPLTVDVLNDVEVAMTLAFPQLQGQPERYESLVTALTNAEQKGTLRFSRNAKTNRYPYYHKGFLPLKITVIPPKKEKRVVPDVIWHPEIQSASLVTDQRLKEQLVRINEWLIAHPTARQHIVSAQERSLQIFGTEKALKGGVIVLPDGKIVDDAFLAYRAVEPPLGAREPLRVSTSNVGLILENISSYDAFGDWNESSLAFAVVVCGEGKRILGSPRRLKELADRFGVIEWRYFGDIDPEGLKIALDVAAGSRRVEGPIVLPLSDAYRWLARYGETSMLSRKTSEERSLWLKIKDDVLDWTQSSLIAHRCEEVLASGTLIAQEWLGTTELAKVGALVEIARHRPMLPDSKRR
jgi:hypothetical protein